MSRAHGGCFRSVMEMRRAGHDGMQCLAMSAPLPLSRGLHSFPFQLNLSSSVHRMTQINS